MTRRLQSTLYQNQGGWYAKRYGQKDTWKSLSLILDTCLPPSLQKLPPSSLSSPSSLVTAPMSFSPPGCGHQAATYFCYNRVRAPKVPYPSVPQCTPATLMYPTYPSVPYLPQCPTLPYLAAGTVWAGTGATFHRGKVDTTQITVHCINCIATFPWTRVYTKQCRLYGTQYIWDTTLCTAYSVKCKVYSIQCTVYSVQCTVYSV